MADEAASWNDLHARFDVARIDHQPALQRRRGVYTNGAEEFFSRMRRAEIGHHHHIAGRLSGPLRAGERMARGSSPGGQRRQVQAVVALAMAAPAVRGLVRVLAAGGELNP